MKTQHYMIIILLFCVILSSVLSGCLMKTDSIIVDGLERTYCIHVPKGFDEDTSVPLVLVFHGGGGNARNIQETTSFNQKADEEGFLVVYPQGSGTLQNHLLTWNAGFCCAYAYENSIDDVSFIKELVNHLKAQYTINDSRIYATGISNGGIMTYRLGAELSDIFAAIAPVAASIGGQPTENESLWCIPELMNPVSVIVFHGTNDTRVPYEGGRP
ncbi:MAG: PHB depolymerase family esterase, partial [Thermoplasmatota archaeon]